MGALRSVMVVAAVLVVAGGAGAQVYRCSLPGGTVVYSDKPCQSGAPNAQPKQDAVIPPAAAPDKVQFSGNAGPDYIKAAALLDNIRTIGRECEIHIKVYGGKLNEACRIFLEKVRPGGEAVQVTDRVLEMNTDPANVRKYAREMSRIERYTAEVLEQREFVAASIRARR